LLRLIGRSLTCASLCVLGASSLGCSSDNDGAPQGYGGAGGSPTGSAGAGAGGMLGVAGTMGTPGGAGPGGAGPGAGGSTASARVQFVLKEVH
jgi:hypothetical protein